MAKKFSKTNAMRLLEQVNIPYQVREYPDDGPVGAVDVANFLGEEPDRLFKTLVTTDHGDYYVFCIPGDHELDLKKAAKVVGVKKIEMIPQRELFPLTGYVHGGCSPFGMKKSFPTVVDSSALNWKTIYVSGGKRGHQIEIRPKDFEKILDVNFYDVTK
ncbi:MAG: Cys-tRNA(Pro) deacylase [Tissierellia bacterium]|nr:Cys-tRNA(Pro) deacylase [Tissierellia bacterium]